MNPDLSAKRPASNVPASSVGPRPPVSREAIANLAAEIWGERGRPSGADDAIWLEAERRLQVDAEARLLGQTASRSAANPIEPPRPPTKSSDPAEAPGALRPVSEEKRTYVRGNLRSQ